MNPFVQNITESFQSGGKGSARKFSTFWMMLLVTALELAYIKKAFIENDFTLLTTLVVIDLTFILVLLGLTTWQGMSTGKPSAEPPTVKD